LAQGILKVYSILVDQSGISNEAQKTWKDGFSTFSQFVSTIKTFYGRNYFRPSLIFAGYPSGDL